MGMCSTSVLRINKLQSSQMDGDPRPSQVIRNNVSATFGMTHKKE